MNDDSDRFFYNYFADLSDPHVRRGDTVELRYNGYACWISAELFRDPAFAGPLGDLLRRKLIDRKPPVKENA